jgi:hypothetical protein
MHDVYSLIIPWKIRETLNFHRLMNDHAFSTTILKPPIRLDENSLSTIAWNFYNIMLANDPCSLNGVFRKNGFEVDSANGMLQVDLGNGN